ncbi:MAG: Uma2 family endonuclease [Synechococcales cyanobacterium RM1_1_8]|nr:Uma2 family endonuclease [Synechococcales cyanobacterium RM1_1_8]
MVAQPPVRTNPEILYPDSDGQPMADNTKQFRWIVTLKENLEILFAQDPNVFIAGDLLWYPVEGNNKLRQAPDAMVVFGRPKGDRGSYRQWEEDNIAPQVVFEILSPGNRPGEMTRKALFYQNYGVEEYYLYDPDSYELSGWQWRGPNMPQNDAAEIADMQGWVSPRLGIRFEVGDDGLVVYNPQGTPFLTPVQLAQQRDEAQQQRDEAQQQRDEAQARAALLAKKLRELGVDPDEL